MHRTQVSGLLLIVRECQPRIALNLLRLAIAAQLAAPVLAATSPAPPAQGAASLSALRQRDVALLANASGQNVTGSLGAKREWLAESPPATCTAAQTNRVVPAFGLHALLDIQVRGPGVLTNLMFNLEEFEAGTMANDPRSVFRLQSVLVNSDRHGSMAFAHGAGFNVPLPLFTCRHANTTMTSCIDYSKRMTVNERAGKP